MNKLIKGKHGIFLHVMPGKAKAKGYISNDAVPIIKVCRVRIHSGIASPIVINMSTILCGNSQAGFKLSNYLLMHNAIIV